MAQFVSDILAQPDVRGMQILDRSKFLRNVDIPVLKVKENKISPIVKCCKEYFLKLDNFKPVQTFEESLNASNEGPPSKCVFLNPDKVKSWSDIKEIDRNKLIEHGVDESCFDTKLVELTYENWRSDQIFKAVLPAGEEIVAGFSHIGHIVHLNLRDHLVQYKTFIGQVLLDKIKNCRTVVNKSNIIDNTYRNFAMEVIAGEEEFEVTVKENNCTFQFDFSKVYWNPRLGKEHERILAMLKPGDVLFDVFCGVGPFSIPASKKKVKVFANDLNPDSFKWLNHNAKLNKMNPLMFKSYNEDGKKFICNEFQSYLKDLFIGKEKICSDSKVHVTMNLPAMAVEFLSNFNGLLKEFKIDDTINVDIIVHVYCFAVGEEPEKTALNMVENNLQTEISSNLIEVFNVRNVSPKKEMMRVSFKLTKTVLQGINKKRQNNNELPAQIKVCVESA